MSLTLPTNFQNDIQGRDTNLVPIVCFGNYPWDTGIPDFALSTCEITTGELPVYNFLPILLNIPSIKHSVDLMHKNYKISNVTLSISNLPYNGKRFSDIVAEQPGNVGFGEVGQALINMECRIFWISPSSTQLALADVNASFVQDDSALEVYYGNVRKYEHDDEKVKIILEDKSQSILHRDLPTSVLGSTDTIPLKYRNKRVPMVYGHVKRSPVVIAHYGDTPNENDTTGRYTILPDNVYNLSGTQLNVEYGNYSNFTLIKGIVDYNEELHPQVQIFGDSANKAHLHIYRNNTYGAVLKDYNLNSPDVNSTPLGIMEDENYLDSIQYEEIASDANNQIQYLFILSRQGHTNTGLFETGVNSIGKDQGVIYHTSKIINTKIYNPDDNSSFEGTFRFGTGDTHDAEELLIKYNYLFTDNYAPIGGPEDWGLCNWKGLYNPKEFHSIKYHFRFESPPTSYNNVYYSHYIMASNFYWNSWAPPTFSGVLRFFFVDQANDMHEIHASSWFNEDWEGEAFGCTPPYSEALSSGFLTCGIDSNSSTNNASVRAKFVPDYSRLSTMTALVVDKFIESDFYMNVKGRALYDEWDGDGQSPLLHHVIEDILKTELWYNDDVGYHHAVWGGRSAPVHFNFTITEPINSKLLIEQLCSLGLSIPHFTVMGEFKLNMIPTAVYAAQIDVDNLLFPRIYKADVIDFSYSRTRIEDVYTKISFDFNWDYARETFTENYTISVKDPDEYNPDNLIVLYDYEYYGFKDEWGEDTDDHSTLVINDHRGKFIRYDTYADDGPSSARELLRSLLMWHCNQHLILNIKLPVKYLFLEIGDFITISDILGDVLPYGIDYSPNSYFSDPVDSAPCVGQLINASQAFPAFVVTSTKQTLEFVEISCTQIHNTSNYGYQRHDTVMGCTEELAWNYDEGATTDFYPSNCISPEHYILSPDGTNTMIHEDLGGCPFEVNPAGGEAEDPAIADLATNYAGNTNAEWNPNWELSLLAGEIPTSMEAGGQFVILNNGDGPLGYDQVSARAFLYYDPDSGTYPIIRNYANCLWVDSTYHKITSVDLQVQFELGIWTTVGYREAEDGGGLDSGSVWSDADDIKILLDERFKAEYLDDSSGNTGFGSPAETIDMRIVYQYVQNTPTHSNSANLVQNFIDADTSAEIADPDNFNFGSYNWGTWESNWEIVRLTGLNLDQEAWAPSPEVGEMEDARIIEFQWTYGVIPISSFNEIPPGDYTLEYFLRFNIHENQYYLSWHNFLAVGTLIEEAGGDWRALWNGETFISADGFTFDPNEAVIHVDETPSGASRQYNIYADDLPTMGNPQWEDWADTPFFGQWQTYSWAGYNRKVLLNYHLHVIAGVQEYVEFNRQQQLQFYVPWEEGICEGEPGDINNDGDFNVIDTIMILHYCILSPLADCFNPSYLTHGCRGDLTGDGMINILDVIQLVDLIIN